MEEKNQFDLSAKETSSRENKQNPSMSQRPLFWQQNKVILMCIQLVVSGLMLYFLLKGFNWQQFFELMHQIPFTVYLYTFCLNFVCQLLYIGKWAVVLRAMNVKEPFGILFWQYFVGFFFANLAPSSIGQDGVRIYYSGKRWGYLKIGSSVLVDRFLSLFTMIVLAAGSVLVVDSKTSLYEGSKIILFVLVLLFILFLVLVWLPIENHLNPFGFKNKVVQKSVDYVHRIIMDMRIAGCNLTVLSASFIMIGAVFVIMANAYNEFFSVLHGQEVKLLSVIAAILIISVITNLPIALNGIGVREQSHYLYFAVLGIPKEIAVTVSLMFFSQTLLYGLLGLSFWFLGERNIALRKKVP